MQARTLFKVTVSDRLRLLCCSAKKVIDSIDFFRFKFWCVVGVYYGPSAELQLPAVFLLGVRFHVEGG